MGQNDRPEPPGLEVFDQVGQYDDPSLPRPYDFATAPKHVLARCDGWRSLRSRPILRKPTPARPSPSARLGSGVRLQTTAAGAHPHGHVACTSSDHGRPTHAHGHVACSKLSQRQRGRSRLRRAQPTCTSSDHGSRTHAHGHVAGTSSDHGSRTHAHGHVAGASSDHGSHTRCLADPTGEDHTTDDLRGGTAAWLSRVSDAVSWCRRECRGRRPCRG
jgi:hypothetical protein